MLTLGHDFNKPMPKWRREISKTLFVYFSYLNAFAVGLIINTKEVDADYTQWLGKDYKKNKLAEGFRCPTYVANHTGWNDITVMLAAHSGDISFLGGDFIENIPVVRGLMVISESLFVPRGGSSE